MSRLSSVIFLGFLALVANSFQLRAPATSLIQTECQSCLESKTGTISQSFNSSVQSDPASHNSTSPTWLSIPSGCKAPYPLLFSSAGYNWTFSKYQELNDTFEVYQPLYECSSRYLAVSTSCDDLYVSTISQTHCDEFSHVWVVKAVPSRTGFYTMTNYNRMGCSKSLLSTNDDGTLYLTDVDDGSGKQHWILPGVPTTLSALNDITSSGSIASTRASAQKKLL